jgi:hypothetical protein
MSAAAKLRWAKARKAKEAAARAAKAPQKPAPAKRKPTAPREFHSALKTAEKRLAAAILERSKAQNTYAVLSAEIPSLQRLIIALRNPLGAAPEYAAPAAATLEQIVGDQPVEWRERPYSNPYRDRVPAQPEIIPVIPVPQELHPANTIQQTRGGGGAVGVALEEPEDEDQFLRESGVSGGQWH